MCFGSTPDLPKPIAPPTLAVPTQTPIQQQQPNIQTGADQASEAQTGAPRRKSLFQIDLTVPPSSGANPQGGTSAGAGGLGGGSSTGAATR